MKRTIASVILLSVFFSLNGFGQAGITYDLVKPAKYENRPLGYEKTETTKFKLPRHFIQNTITHYNYYFNTNRKLNEILVRAKAGFKDDFTRLLPFYNYSFEVLARDKRNLDSVIDKVNTAILVRDLRNDWTDNMYMLMGQAYYYKNRLDSAYVLFQFINYAYAPKEKDGYPIPIGSNANGDEGGNAFTISTNEKRNIVKKAFSLPPSRNEALIWQVRTYLARNEMTKAAVLIEILKNDPQFPKRLNSSLHEMEALWFYDQKVYDSAAYHLNLALDVAVSENERGRWDYLIAQLYEISNQSDLAKIHYESAASHATDPVMEVYARLNAIRQNKGDKNRDDYIRKNLDALHRMSRKEIYAPYQDIIFFAAGEIEMERNHRSAAIAYFKKSLLHGSTGTLRDRTFLKLGWLAIDAKTYKLAKNSYDSINMADLEIADSIQIVQDRRKALNRIVPLMLTIERQDSLQRIAAMTEPERNAYIKKMIRDFRRQQGLKEDEQASGGFAFGSNTANADLFGSSGSGEWYFNNPTAKAKGFSDFRSKWGTRQNTDNWQVQSLAAKTKLAVASNAPGQGNATDANPAATAAPVLTAAALLANVPLTPEKLKKSRDSVENALFALGKSMQDYLPDYLSAITAYDSLLSQFPVTRFYEPALYNEYYCYLKLHDDANATRILNLLKTKFPNGKLLQQAIHPVVGAPDKAVRAEATTQYEKVYGDMIEGNFAEAVAEKKKADSLYGDKYWTPQLLYVEAVYYMHTRQDSAAKASLNAIIRKFNGSDMAGKAKNVLNVLNRRREIEDYLTHLKIERAKEDSTVVFNDKPAPTPVTGGIPYVPKKATAADSAALAQAAKRKADSLMALKIAPNFKTAFLFAPDKPHSVVILMTKVDPVYVTESRNAFNRYNRENYYGSTFDINNVSLNDTLKLVVISGFENAAAAIAYMDKTGKIAGREIIPWLPANKYSFYIITDNNLDVLKTNKDIPAYRKFLSVYFPDKFH